MQELGKTDWNIYNREYRRKFTTYYFNAEIIRNINNLAKVDLSKKQRIDFEWKTYQV